MAAKAERLKQMRSMRLGAVVGAERMDEGLHEHDVPQRTEPGDQKPGSRRLVMGLLRHASKVALQLSSQAR